MEPDSLNLTDEERATLDELAKKTGKSREQILQEAFSFFLRCYNTLREAGALDESKQERAAAVAG